MRLSINKNTKIVTDIYTKPVLNAIQNLERDIEATCCDSEQDGLIIYLRKKPLLDERFHILLSEEGLLVQSHDDLGFIYGIYHISRNILGIHDFWFWNDQKMIKRDGYEISEKYEYQSIDYAVRFRGWFINDEVLLHTWTLDRKKDKPWEIAFETLLRCGGNLIIPGTDRNSKYYSKLASDMGLIITHHHAEPLGSEMFARVYPDLNASYEEHPDKFQKLWQDGIRKQNDYKVIWNLGFRGQGDCPFWENDPRYETQEMRGALMSQLIKIQYDFCKECRQRCNMFVQIYMEKQWNCTTMVF
jgi:hypothetical protein